MKSTLDTSAIVLARLYGGGPDFDKARSVKQELTFTYAENYFKERGLGFGESDWRALGLIDAEGCFTNAALVLSEESDYNVTCFVYGGITKAKKTGRRVFSGSVLKQINDVHEYLQEHNPLTSTFDGLTRVNRPDYPDYALSETLLNTFIHRDYGDYGNTTICIFDNRMEFASPGSLMKGLAVSDVLGGAARPRNTVVADIFRRLGLARASGAGIPRIMENYESSLIKPSFRSAPVSFVVKLPKADYSITPKLYAMPKEERVIALLKAKGEINRKDAEAVTGVSHLTTIKMLNGLAESGRIVKAGVGGTIRYRLP